jgi:uncharacterized protein
MHRIVAGATGLIGTQLVNHWLNQGYAITVIGRSKAKIQNIFQNRVSAIEWVELQPEIFKQAEIVVNLAGAGISEKYWSATRKNEILHSRIKTTEKLVAILQLLGPKSPPLFNASAIGIYGLQQQNPYGLPKRLDESTMINWDNPKDFLSKTGCEWEKATHKLHQSGIRVVNLRFGVVLAKQGGALPQIILPFYFFMGGRIGTGQQPFSWIAIDDLIQAIDFLIEKKNYSGPINIVSPYCVTQRELASAIGQILHKPSFMITPKFLLKLVFGEMAQELLLEGQHVYPARLLELGFCFSFPNINVALTHILQK